MGWAKKLMMEMEEKGNWPSDNLRNKYVCSNHFDNVFIQQLIEEKGEPGICSYCGEKGIVRDMYGLGQDLMWRISLFFVDVNDAGLMLANSFYEDENEVIPGFKRVGDYIAPKENTYYESPEEMMEDLDLLTDDSELNEDIRSLFSVEQWISKDIFEEDKNIRLTNQWDAFVNSVTYKRRFTFLATPEFKSLLNEKEAPREDILTGLRNIIIEQNLCKCLPSGTVVYRARKVDDANKIYMFEDITSPPEPKAFPNRMSPVGISMFYSSFERDTAMNECVGDDTQTIIVGTFETIRDLSVIDLTSIPNNSFWMKGWQENQFLHTFNRNITLRVDPDDKNLLQYVPTQVFTEFLRYMFKDMDGNGIDGLIYGSSKSSEKNLVLFCNQKESSKYVKDINIETYVAKCSWVLRK